MSRAPWSPGRTGPRLEPYQRQAIREAVEARRAEVGVLDARAARTIQQRHGVSRATVYGLAAKGRDDDR